MRDRPWRPAGSVCRETAFAVEVDFVLNGPDEGPTVPRRDAPTEPLVILADGGVAPRAAVDLSLVWLRRDLADSPWKSILTPTSRPSS
jgi:hypothetical protein